MAIPKVSAFSASATSRGMSWCGHPASSCGARMSTVRWTCFPVGRRPTWPSGRTASVRGPRSSARSATTASAISMQAHLEAEQVAADVIAVPGRPTTRIAIVIRPDGEHAFVTDHTRPLRLTTEDLPFRVAGRGRRGLPQRLRDLHGGRRRRLRRRSSTKRGVAGCRWPSTLPRSRWCRGTAAPSCSASWGPWTSCSATRKNCGALAEDGRRGIAAGRIPAGGDQAGCAGRERLATMRDGANAPDVGPGVRMNVIDTTGAGDAFDAAFLVDYFTHGDTAVAPRGRRTCWADACRTAASRARRRAEERTKRLNWERERRMCSVPFDYSSQPRRRASLHGRTKPLLPPPRRSSSTSASAWRSSN